MRSFFLLVGLVLWPLVGAGQTYFNNRYTFNPSWSGGSTLQPVAGGYWIAGCGADLNSPTGVEMWLQFIDQSGATVGPLKRWSRPGYSYYPGFAGALKQTRDGGFSLVGTIRDPNTGGFGMLCRLNSQGDTLWVRRYAGQQPRTAVAFQNGQQLSDRDHILVGQFYFPSPGSAVLGEMDVLLIRTDSLGQERWRRTFSVRKYEWGQQVLPTADGGFLLTGIAWDYDGPSGAENIDGFALKVDSLGQEQWRTTFGGPYNDLAGPVVATPDGGYVIGLTLANTEVNYVSMAQAGLIWLDSAGNITRQRVYGKTAFSAETYALLPLSDGGYVLAGQLRDTATAMRSFLLRVCADGDSVWYRTYYKLPGSASKNYLRDLRQTSDGGFVGAGFLHVRAPDTGTNDVWVFKTDANGYLQPGGSPPTVQCRPNGLPEEAASGGLEVWPNPSADGRFTVRQVRPGATTLTVTDALGRVVWSGKSSGSAETVVDLSHHASGLYLLRVQAANGRTITRKLCRP